MPLSAQTVAGLNLASEGPGATILSLNGQTLGWPGLCLALPVARRQNGLLLALPARAIPVAMLEAAEASDFQGALGPHLESKVAVEDPGDDSLVLEGACT